MKTYARIANGVVAEIIPPMADSNGVEVPIADRFTASFVSTLVDCSATTGVAPGWTYGTTSGFAAPAGPTLAQTQAAQIALIEDAYQTAIQQPVSYMSTTFQADQDSQAVLTKALVAGAVPAGFFWLDKNNAQVSMTFAQLQGLAGAMLTQGQTAFAKKTGLKQQINAATTVAAVQAITW
ncbi:protein of unknown function [Ralstonia solanacearum CMR15]|nr:protein of unknown function [Ralstonia solanacearum CMR15]